MMALDEKFRDQEILTFSLGMTKCFIEFFGNPPNSCRDKPLKTTNVSLEMKRRKVTISAKSQHLSS